MVGVRAFGFFGIAFAVLGPSAAAAQTATPASESTTIMCSDASFGDAARNEGPGPQECHFVEQWEYSYGANFLDVLEAVAVFANLEIQSACAVRGLEFGRYHNPDGTGGISDFEVTTEDRGSLLVYARMSGTFYCVPNWLEGTRSKP